MQGNSKENKKESKKYHTCSPVRGELPCLASASPAGLVSLVRTLEEFFSALASFLVCVPQLEVVCSEDACIFPLLSHKEQPLCNLMFFDYKCFTPLRVDREAAAFSDGLSSD